MAGQVIDQAFVDDFFFEKINDLRKIYQNDEKVGEKEAYELLKSAIINLELYALAEKEIFIPKNPSDPGNLELMLGWVEIKKIGEHTRREAYVLTEEGKRMLDKYRKVMS